MATFKNYNISASYDISPGKPPAPADPDLIMLDDCHEYVLPEERFLIRSKRNGNKRVVTNKVMYSLRFCNAFRTMKGHVAHLISHIPALKNQSGDVGNVLRSMRDAGLMVSAGEIASAIQPERSQPETDPALTLCILTCDRPDTLQRLLDSMVRNQPLNPDHACFIIDDSRAQKNQQQNQAIAKNFNDSYGPWLIYFGPLQQKEFQQQLVSLVPDQQREVEFLIGRNADPDIESYGRSRNFGLLLSAGQKTGVSG